MHYDLDLVVPGKSPCDTKVVVAMSGGVDSSVVAAMLADSGYNVIGITLKLYHDTVKTKTSKACCAARDSQDAKKVASIMNFNHYTVDYTSKFKESVIDDFIYQYLNGATPVPCITCNQVVKFDNLLNAAKKLNADALVTGHYVRRIVNSKKVELHSATDLSKDQSYFLFTTTQDQLEYLRFPLGKFSKEYTRLLAKKFNIPVADKPESQDICFVKKNESYRDFILRTIGNSCFKSGNIIYARTGAIIGSHKGILNYTVGQRKFIDISHHSPLYVISILPEANSIVVGERDLLPKKIFFINKINLLDKIHPEMYVKIRSMQEKQKALVSWENESTIKVELVDNTTESVISPGQACVLYRNTMVIGGGWIMRDDVTMKPS